METSYTPEYYRQKQLEWDIYFLRIAKEVSTKSKCLSRKIGAVLTKDHSIISTGYNGAPRNVKHCNERDIAFYALLDKKIIGSKYFRENTPITQCPRRIFDYKSGQGLHLCQAGHAERNALIQAARNGVSTKDSVLYCYCPIPCKECSIESINAGVKEIVCLKGNDYDIYSRILLEEANVTLREINEELLH